MDNVMRVRIDTTNDEYNSNAMQDDRRSLHV